MVLDFFASFAFYLIPWLIGRLLVKNVFYAWIVGMLSVFFLFFFTEILVFVFPIFPFSFLLQLLLLGLSLISIGKLLVNIPHLSKHTTKQRIQAVAIATALIASSAVLYFFVWKNHTPYPFQLNWDIYEHITLAQELLKGRVSLFPSQISDTFTFNGYSPLFHMLLALPTDIFTTHFIGVYWWLEYLHYFSTIVVSLLFAWRLSRNKILTLLSGVIAACIFESTVAYSSLFLIPQTFVAVITMFAICEVMSEKKPHLLLWIATILVLLLTHYIIGFFGAAMYVLFILCRYKISTGLIEKALLAAGVFFGIILAVHFFGGWTITGREEASHFIFSVDQLVVYLLEWYGLGTLLFLIIGIPVVVRQGTKEVKLVLLVSILSLAVVFAPFSYVLKFYVIGRYFIHIILAVGMTFLLYRLSNRLQWVGVLWTCLVLFVVFSFSQGNYKAQLYFQGNHSHISPAEIEAATWLSSHAKDHMFLISDPSTQYILEALSGINSQGGAYTNSATREKLINTAYRYDKATILQSLYSIQDELPADRPKNRQTLYILSGRYFAWQRLPLEEKRSYSYNIWTPQTIKNSDRYYINALIAETGFKKVFANDEIVILEL